MPLQSATLHCSTAKVEIVDGAQARTDDAASGLISLPLSQLLSLQTTHSCISSMAAPLRTVFSASAHSCRRVSCARTGVANFASSSRVTLDSTRPRSEPSRTTLLDVLDDAPGASSSSAPSGSRSTAAETHMPTFDIPSRASPPHMPAFEIPSRAAPPHMPSPASPTPAGPSASTISSLHLSPKERDRLFRGQNKTIPKYSPIEDPYTPSANSERIHNSQAVTHNLVVQSTRNNIQLSFIDAYGDVFGRITGGTGGVFKKSNRSSYEAAHQAAMKMFENILAFSREHQVQLCVSFKGLFGAGREAVAAAIAGPEGTEFRSLIVRVEDRTPLKIGGNKPRGKRNV